MSDPDEVFVMQDELAFADDRFFRQQRDHADLDWSDVQADADRMRDQMWEEEHERVDLTPTSTLQAERYDLEVVCRASAPEYEVAVLDLINTTLLNRLIEPPPEYYPYEGY